MDGVRGSHAQPGQFRTGQNWIGATRTPRNATYVPPPVPEMMKALDSLEKYLHEPSPLPLLVRHALIHYQFEAVHPFADGNGRVGRLLLTILLLKEGLLAEPLLYLSAYYERNRREYYDRLLAVTRMGRCLGGMDRVCPHGRRGTVPAGGEDGERKAYVTNLDDGTLTVLNTSG